MAEKPQPEKPLALDHWQHRGQRMRCQTCMWWVVKQVEGKLPENPLGRCRKHAPSDKGWVPVYAQDWCGDHRLDENRA